MLDVGTLSEHQHVLRHCSSLSLCGVPIALIQWFGVDFIFFSPSLIAAWDWEKGVVGVVVGNADIPKPTETM